MENITSLINSLRIPASEIVFWDETIGVVEAADLVTGFNLLGEHVTTRGSGGCLCYWMQHYLDDPPVEANRGSLYPLAQAGENRAFWRVSMAGAALPGLATFFEIRNPWYSDAGLGAPCFYVTPTAEADVSTQISITVPAAQVGYVVAGRVIGFDFPQRYLDKVRSLGIRPGEYQARKRGG